MPFEPIKVLVVEPSRFFGPAFSEWLTKEARADVTTVPRCVDARVLFDTGPEFLFVAARAPGYIGLVRDAQAHEPAIPVGVMSMIPGELALAQQRLGVPVFDTGNLPKYPLIMLAQMLPKTG